MCIAAEKEDRNLQIWESRKFFGRPIFRFPRMADDLMNS